MNDHGHSAAHPHHHADADHRHVCHHGPLGEHNVETDIICLDHVSYRYDDIVALRDVTLHIETGCNLGIVGPNGGGKTTLLKIVLGLLPDYEGAVDVAGLSPAEVCRRGDVVGYVPQRHDFEPRFPVSVRQVVRMGLCGRTGLLRRPSRADREYAEQLMDEVGIAEIADRPIGELSGGQQQRAFIARALAPKPRILLLDEPTVGIDPAGQRRFAELIHRLHESLGVTIVVVSHDLRTVAAGCGKVAVLNQTIHFHDAPEGLTQELLKEVFEHDIAPVLG